MKGTFRAWRALDRIAEASAVERPEYRLIMPQDIEASLGAGRPGSAGAAGAGSAHTRPQDGIRFMPRGPLSRPGARTAQTP